MTKLKRNIIDTHDELQVCRYANGIKLVNPQKSRQRLNISYQVNHSVGSLLNLPIAMYFSNTNHITLKCNEISAEECGYASLTDTIGKPWYQYFKSNTIAEPLANCNEIYFQNTASITYENATRKDGSSNDSLAIRMPWYNDKNEIVGLFGCAILPHKNPLAESLTLIARLGILNFNHINQTQQLIGSEINQVYLSKREIECLQLTIRGKTSKEIARNLKLSKWTVEEYLSNIKSKLGVSTKSELIDKTFDHLFSKTVI